MSQTNDTPGIYFYTENKTGNEPPKVMSFTGAITGFGRSSATDIGIDFTLFGPKNKSFDIGVFDFLRSLLSKPGNIKVTLGECSPESRTQLLARLGVQLARLMGEMYKTQMTHSQIAELSSKTERLTAEILQLSESWEPSNE